MPPTRRNLVAGVALGAIATVLVGGCVAEPDGRAVSDRAGLGVAAATAAPAPPATAAPVVGSAPTRRFGVRLRTLSANRGGSRPLRISVWYPVGPGPFPVVVFSHGLTGLPTDYRSLLTGWAASGFVVVAPAYPHTSRGARRFDALDVVNQPADASYVLTRVLALNRAAGDPLRGKLRTDRIAAAGHSGGAITTVGLFTSGRDERLDAGIVLAGNAVGVGDAYAGPPAPLLFVHGERDDVTPYAFARSAYVRAPWPKAFLTLPGEGHVNAYLNPGSEAFLAVAAATTEFLRWTLYDDPQARRRLGADEARDGLGTLDNQLG